MKLCKNCGSAAEFPSGKCRCGSQNIIFIIDTSQWYNMSSDERQNKIMSILNVDADQFEMIKDMWCDNKTYLLDYDEETHQNRIASNAEIRGSNTIRCPYCKSADVKKTTTLSRALSVGLFGLASKKIDKQWHCNNCKSDF